MTLITSSIGIMRNLVTGFGARMHNSALKDCVQQGLSFMEHDPEARILDAGCGNGELTELFAGAVGSDNMFGIEAVSDAAKLAEGRNIRVSLGDMEERWPFPDDEFNVVVSSQSIEHVGRSRFYVSEMRRVLKPGGYAVIMTTNLACWTNILPLVLGWEPPGTSMVEGRILGLPPVGLQYQEELSSVFEGPGHPTMDSSLPKRAGPEEHHGPTGAYGHVRVLSYRGLLDLLSQGGLDLQSVKGSGYYPFSGRISRLLSALDPRHTNFLSVKARKPLR